MYKESDEICQQTGGGIKSRCLGGKRICIRKY